MPFCVLCDAAECPQSKECLRFMILPEEGSIPRVEDFSRACNVESQYKFKLRIHKGDILKEVDDGSVQNEETSD